jgi:hypothetical protein
MIKITRFEKDGQKIWKNDGIFSGCIKATSESFDLETWSENVTTHMNWIKGNSEEIVERTIGIVTKQIEAGNLVPYRVFSETPLYEGQEEDINPTTQAKLGRYSQSRLGTPEKALEMDRKFITVEVKLTAEPIKVEVSRSKVTTSSLKDDTSILLEETEVSKETIHKNYNADKNNQYFEEEKKGRLRKEEEKGYSWVKLIFFLFGLLFVLMIFFGALNGIGEVLSSIPWYLNIVLTIGGVFVIAKIIE